MSHKKEKSRSPRSTHRSIWRTILAKLCFRNAQTSKNVKKPVLAADPKLETSSRKTSEKREPRSGRARERIGSLRIGRKASRQTRMRGDHNVRKERSRVMHAQTIHLPPSDGLRGTAEFKQWSSGTHDRPYVPLEFQHSREFRHHHQQSQHPLGTTMGPAPFLEAEEVPRFDTSIFGSWRFPTSLDESQSPIDESSWAPSVAMWSADVDNQDADSSGSGDQLLENRIFQHFGRVGRVHIVPESEYPQCPASPPLSDTGATVGETVKLKIRKKRQPPQTARRMAECNPQLSSMIAIEPDIFTSPAPPPAPTAPSSISASIVGRRRDSMSTYCSSRGTANTIITTSSASSLQNEVPTNQMGIRQVDEPRLDNMFVKESEYYAIRSSYAPRSNLTGTANSVTSTDEEGREQHYYMHKKTQYPRQRRQGNTAGRHGRRTDDNGVESFNPQRRARKEEIRGIRQARKGNTMGTREKNSVKENSGTGKSMGGASGGGFGGCLAPALQILTNEMDIVEGSSADKMREHRWRSWRSRAEMQPTVESANSSEIGK